MTAWQLSVLCLLPLVLCQRAAGAGWPFHKMRVMAALLLAAYVGQRVTPEIGYPPVLWYAVIDFLAGAAIIARPAGIAQKAIGACFAGMILYHAGFAGAMWWYGPSVNAVPYYAFQKDIGWMQFAILAAWGGWDSGSAVYNCFLRRRSLVADSAIEGAG